MRLVALVFWLVVCFGVALVGARLTVREVKGWYKTLSRPVFNPPDGIFPVVWNVLYFVMAIAAWQIGGELPSRFRTAGLILFVGQLALNLAWSWIFFRRHALGAAFAEVLVLWAAIGATTLLFFQVRPSAGWLMTPYWAWVSFASVLNGAIWKLNGHTQTGTGR